jgi:hypothetical protein
MSKSVEEIVVDIKKKKSPVTKILEERAEEQMQEYEQTKLERMIAEEKARIQIVQKEGKTLEPKVASDFTAQILQLAEVDPAKAKAFIQSLDQEDLNKIAFLMSAGSNRGDAFLNLARSPGTSVKELVELLKIMRPDNGGTDLKGIAEVFKLGMEAAKSSAPQGQQQTPIEIFKMVKEFVEPFQQSLGQKDKELWEERMQRLQSQIVNPLDWYKAQKELMKEFGVSSGGKSEVDLKLAEMGQTERLENRKLDWEMRKSEKQEEADTRKWEQIGRIFEGPVGRVMENFGKAGADKLRGTPSKNALKPVQVACPNPNCKKPFYADESALSVVCPHCGAILEKQTSASPPPQPQPPAQPPQAEVPQPTEASQPASEQQQPQPEQ